MRTKNAKERLARSKAHVDTDKAGRSKSTEYHIEKAFRCVNTAAERFTAWSIQSR